MAHDLEIKADGTASFFSGEGITPWHGLGVKIDGLATASEALQLAGLDWTVRLEPIFFSDPEGEYGIDIPGRYATVRSTDNKPLGVVGSDYKIHQNVEAFSFFDTVTDAGSGEAHYTAAGALAGGSRIFLTAKIGDRFDVAGQDAHDMYLLITTSHDGTRSFTAATTLVRAVCANTVTMALNGAKSKWSLRHKSTLVGRVQEAREALNLSTKYKDAFEKEVQKMMDIQVNADQFKAIVSNVLPDQKRQKDKNIDSLMNIFTNEKTVIDAAGAGTAWGAYNAATYWLDHAREVRSIEARYKSLTDGFAFTTRSQVKDRLLALA